MKAKGRISIGPILKSFGRHLVYAEGTKTELNYVSELRNIIADANKIKREDLTIIPVYTKETHHTVDLIEYAKKDVKKRTDNGEQIDNVWIFYDKDSFDDFDKASYMIKRLNSKNKTNIEWVDCWSNECFEVWIYHYFENLVTGISRKQYIKKIDAFIKQRGFDEQYSKSENQLHSLMTKCGGSIDLAIKLIKKKSDINVYPRPNPSSGIWQFGEFIIAYLNGKPVIDNE